jgi:hypothetical protein
MVQWARVANGCLAGYLEWVKDAALHAVGWVAWCAASVSGRVVRSMGLVPPWLAPQCPACAAAAVAGPGSCWPVLVWWRPGCCLARRLIRGLARRRSGGRAGKHGRANAVAID